MGVKFHGMQPDKAASAGAHDIGTLRRGHEKLAAGRVMGGEAQGVAGKVAAGRELERAWCSVKDLREAGAMLMAICLAVSNLTLKQCRYH